MKRLISSLAALTLLAGAIEQMEAGMVYDAAADFSSTNNITNGIWSYGKH